MPPLEGAFEQVAAVLLIAVAVGVVASLLRQPLLVGFIGVGILVGPWGLGIVEEHDEIALLAKIGIALLLFVVGLRLDLGLIRSVGPVALAAGLGQVAFTSAVGYGLAAALGFGAVEALYIAVALTFSSTIIIVKLLSDKQELEELHGRIAVGFLIVQDVVVVFAIIGLSAFGGPQAVAGGFGAEVLGIALRGLAFLGGIAAVSRWVVPPLQHRLARVPELLVLAAIAWAVGLAALSALLGFSEEVGAFVAGVSLASSPYRELLGARLVSLRDFLLLFFFIDLGSRMDLSVTLDHLTAAIVLSLFVLVGNPLIVMTIMGAMGYRKRVSFKAGLTVAQISEFSLILVALGLTLGHIGASIVGVVTTVGLVTIALSTYLILYADGLYRLLGRWLSVFERRTVVRGPPGEDGERPEVVVFGLGRFGGNLVARLHERGVRVLGVDLDPQVLRHWSERGVPVCFGDAEAPEFPKALSLRDARWVICSASRVETNKTLLAALREHGFRGRVALTAHREEQARELARLDPDRVLRPFAEASEHALVALGFVEEQPAGDAEPPASSASL